MSSSFPGSLFFPSSEVPGNEVAASYRHWKSIMPFHVVFWFPVCFIQGPPGIPGPPGPVGPKVRILELPQKLYRSFGMEMVYIFLPVCYGNYIQGEWHLFRVGRGRWSLTLTLQYWNFYCSRTHNKTEASESKVDIVINLLDFHKALRSRAVLFCHNLSRLLRSLRSLITLALRALLVVTDIYLFISFQGETGKIGMPGYPGSDGVPVRSGMKYSNI